MAQSALRALTQQLMQSGPAPAGMASAQTAIQSAAQRPQQKPMGQQIADVLGGVALPLSAAPVLGDIVGLGADAAMYANYPEERTALNYGLTLAGILPFVPSAQALKALKGMTEDQYIQAINPRGRIPDEARPNLGMGDMYGMLPKKSKYIGAEKDPEFGDIRFYESDGNIYATAYNPDLPGEDVVGFIVGNNGSTELAVVNELQGRGIGTNLSYQFRARNPMAPAGGMTQGGESAARKAFRQIQKQDTN